MTQGFVHIVGTGPGNPDLVTVRARELIASADVAVYDDVVNPAVLAWCRPECEKIRVEKEARPPALRSEQVGALLVDRARAGQRVVRLKGGDPLVFSRAGEDMRRLAADGIPFEVVPGITAALAAGACTGIPLTQFGAGTALILLPGDADPQQRPPAVEWRRYGALPNATLVIYMGAEHLRAILAELLAGGLRPETPAAAVQWASLGRQRSLTATAATLADRAAAAKLGAPAVILIGEHVRRQEAADWFEHQPLFGRRVAVTRARDQAGELRRRLEALGAEVLDLPLVEIRPVTDRETTVDVMSELGKYDWLVFTSANGVRHFFDLVFKGFKDIRAIGAMRVACIGEATARAVRALHLEVEVCPATATSEALADAMIATDGMDNATVLVITGNLNRDALVKKLEGGRAIVDRFQVYENVRTDLTDDAAAEDFRQRGADAILFASSSAAQAYAAQPALKLARAARRPLAGSIGPVTSEAMRQAGLTVDFEAAEATLDALIAAVVAKLSSG